MFSEEAVSEFILNELGNNSAISRISPGTPRMKLTKDEDAIIISLGLVVFYGVNIPQLCYEIQSQIKNKVEEMCGTEVKSVNIEIEGIDKIQ